ncbi:MAG: hypothetical protein ACI9WU_003630 [Myxococcota bacterium]|jgi:hypothetical protein
MRDRTLPALCVAVLLTLPACSDGEPVEGGADANVADTDAGSAAGTDGVDVVAVDPCADLDCDDGLSCTDDGCVQGACAWALQADTCLIGGQCQSDGTPHPASSCRVCDASDPHVWTDLDGTSCDGGQCAESGTCTAGACVVVALDCPGDGACRDGSCDPETGECVTAPANDGAACDGGPCALSGLCAGGACLAAPAACDDGDACTADACVEGCTHTLIPDAPCQDGDACTLDDLCDDSGVCTGGAFIACDDGDLCTLDVCEPTVGCAFVPDLTPCCVVDGGTVALCDDDDPCTTDSCDPATYACTNMPFDGACDDGDLCTDAGTCTDGLCVALALSCDDGQPCTEDFCSPTEGCAHLPLSGSACDDGLVCSTDDLCIDGVCTADTSQCACTPTLDADADGARVSALQIGTDGQVGSGLDVDGDPATCAPAGDCAAGVDNAFAPLAGLANEALASAVAEGTINLLLELPGDKSADMELRVHQGEESGDGCEPGVIPCDYIIAAAGFDPLTCAPLFALPATLDGTTLTAGGPGSQLPISVPVQGVLLEVILFDVRVQAEVELVEGQVVSATGNLAGALRQDALLAALDAVDPAALPLPVETIKSLLQNLLTLDIDTDGDGVDDAVSMGMSMDAVDINLIGIAP